MEAMRKVISDFVSASSDSSQRNLLQARVNVTELVLGDDGEYTQQKSLAKSYEEIVQEHAEDPDVPQEEKWLPASIDRTKEESN
jgi:hypothetical protein